MTTERLIAIAAALLSFLFSYFPAVANRYAVRSPVEKRQIMAVWLLIVTAAIFAASCTPALLELATRFEIAVECSGKSMTELIYLYLLAIVVNQAVFLISPKTRKLDIKSGRNEVYLPDADEGFG